MTSAGHSWMCDVWRILLLSLCVTEGMSYFVVIEPDSSECYFDRVKIGTKIGLTFEVVEGGFMDIDVQVGSLIFF